jgi:Nickel responsive protein SCO4226-like
MKKFIIERKLPGAGNMTAEELKAISKVSVAVISTLGRPYKWVQSFVTEDKIYCIHEAENEEDIRNHGKCGDFPVNGIEEIKAVISPDTAL